MQAGDRVVVLESEHRGTIDQIGRDEFTGCGVVLVTRDDLVGTPLEKWNPIPYDPFELEVCNVPTPAGDHPGGPLLWEGD